jgi:hypothetical protein
LSQSDWFNLLWLAPATKPPHMIRFQKALCSVILLILLLLLSTACTSNSNDSIVHTSNEYTWWKGNLHTHTLWSDGDHYPEYIVDWYKEKGYHFLSMSDHNTLQEGNMWIQPEYYIHAESGGGLAVFEQYLEKYGEEWVEHRIENDTLETRLKPLNEYRHLFEEAGRFMLIHSEEITDEKLIHVNAHNILRSIPPQGGETEREIIQNNVNAVHQHHHETGRAMFPHLNHPNFHYAVTAEDLAGIEGLQFFEVYNGHRSVNNYGDDYHVDLDKFWDIVLTLRLAHYDLGIMYGLAVDDSHHYNNSIEKSANPGRGWVMVRSKFLTPEHIINNLKSGDFYSTTGVEIDDFGADHQYYYVDIDEEEGIDYTIQFIGTNKNHDISSEPVLDEGGHEIRATRIYNDDIGKVLEEVQGPSGTYRFTGDEIYVRAKIISSKKHPNPFREGDTEMAWTQPFTVE